MDKEFLTKTSRSVTLNVTAGKIDSFREKEETTSTVRVYEDGFVGIAGSLGRPDEETLTSKAKDALELRIPYPCALEGELDEGVLEREVRNEKEIIPVPKLIPTMQSFLDRLGEECPRFAFSNKIGLKNEDAEYRNSCGRHLVSSTGRLSINLIAQNRGSGNLFDSAFGYSGDHFDEDVLVSKFKEQYDAFYKDVDLESGRYPVFFETSDLMGTFLQQFVGELYVAGASLLSGKLGQDVFSEKLTFQDDMNPYSHPGTCFFDDEGCVARNYRPTLIEKGRLVNLLTTKKSSSQFGLSNLGTAVAPYDGVPSLGFRGFYLEPTAESLRELVPGKAIFVVLASGGDMTPDGHFATPVQMSYLMEDGRLVGRLPELNVSGDFFNLLGKDYIGAACGDPLDDSRMCAVMMDVARS